MNIMSTLLNYYRKISILLGIVIPIICYFMISDANILNDPFQDLVSNHRLKKSGFYLIN